MKTEKELNEQNLNELTEDEKNSEHWHQTLKSEVQALQKEIEQKIRERKLLNNDLVKEEAAAKLQKIELTNLKQQKKEQTNKI
jgi:hypothetical protein